MLMKKSNDGTHFLRLQPVISRDQAVVFVNLTVAFLPIVKLSWVKLEIMQNLFVGYSGQRDQVCHKVNQTVPFIRDHPATF